MVHERDCAARHLEAPAGFKGQMDAGRRREGRDTHMHSHTNTAITKDAAARADTQTQAQTHTLTLTQREGSSRGTAARTYRPSLRPARTSRGKGLGSRSR